LKRSEYVALGAAGLLAFAMLSPSNVQPLPPEDQALDKGDGFQTLAFANLEECKATQVVTASTCELEFKRAEQIKVADAPKFENLASCEQEYGAAACRSSTWNGASVFVPVMAGFLVARSLSGSQTEGQPLYPPRTGPASCPPGVQGRPECEQRTSGGSSGTSSSGSSSGRRYYSTGTGRTVGRVAGSVLTDVFLPSRTTVNRGSSSRPSTYSSPSTSSRTASRSPTVSRGGFGSTSRSISSSGRS
jgi:uncharacterized protein YgiB involved in biofilm formation